jgi:predicted Na+-dependent transporter
MTTIIITQQAAEQSSWLAGFYFSCNIRPKFVSYFSDFLICYIIMANFCWEKPHVVWFSSFFFFFFWNFFSILNPYNFANFCGNIQQNF